jgi:hypothetical protein
MLSMQKGVNVRKRLGKPTEGKRMVNVDASFAPVTGGGATGVIIRDCGGDLEDFRHRRDL